MTIPLARPDFDGRELEALREVLASGWVIQGPRVEAFEKALGECQEARHCVVVSSGTAALHTLYLALGIADGQAVFVPSFAWPAAANAARICGARPVLADCLGGTYNMDPADLRAQVAACLRHGWGRPRCVVVVHEFGLAADLDAIARVAREHGMEVIEDAACALGATYGGRKVGALARAGIFSFHPRKAITTGEGGAIVTQDADLAEACRQVRNHGQAMHAGRRDFVRAGLNYRMTDLQGAIGCVQLGKLPAILAARRRLAEAYLQRLDGCRRLALPQDHPEHTWQTFMVVLEDGVNREDVVGRLAERGVQAGPGSVAAHCTRAYREALGLADSDLPVSARLHYSGLALPLFGGMSLAEADHCARCLIEALQ